mgnify:CR=1 FL=1
MDIEAPEGTRVKFFGPVSEEGIKWGSHDDPRDLLQIEGEYIVDHTEIHSWHTKVFLKEFPGKSFNSVWFAEI